MKEYPSIPRGKIVKGVQIYAFDKLDGSQIRAEWSKKRGRFWKFGTKSCLISEQDKGYWGEAAELIRHKYEDALISLFKEERWLKATCYFEFWGENSFAGRHQDEPHDVTLFGAAADKKGLLLPKHFLDLFEGVDTAKLLYCGNANDPFLDSVRDGTLEGMTFEGVVCKGPFVSPGRPLMFKYKNAAWLEKLKGLCGDDQKLFERLA